MLKVLSLIITNFDTEFVPAPCRDNGVYNLSFAYECNLMFYTSDITDSKYVA